MATENTRAADDAAQAIPVITGTVMTYSYRCKAGEAERRYQIMTKDGPVLVEIRSSGRESADGAQPERLI